MYVDAHTHLVHPRFAGQEDEVARRAAEAGLELVVVNGLDPASNRAVLELCARHEHLLPALGLYPVEAVAARIDPATWPHPWGPPEPFDADAEIDHIDAVADRLVAIGECGLDQHWVKDQAAEQERILCRLLEVALRHDLPVILHTRRAEERTFDILREVGVARADFHCFGGRTKLAVRIAERGYHFSIPPVVERAEGFQALVRKLPLESLLTETDAPYMGPDAGQRNEPANVPRGVRAMAAARRIDADEMAHVIRDNFRRLFRR